MARDHIITTEMWLTSFLVFLCKKSLAQVYDGFETNHLSRPSISKNCSFLADEIEQFQFRQVWVIFQFDRKTTVFCRELCTQFVQHVFTHQISFFFWDSFIEECKRYIVFRKISQMGRQFVKCNFCQSTSTGQCTWFRRMRRRLRQRLNLSWSFFFCSSCTDRGDWKIAWKCCFCRCSENLLPCLCRQRKFKIQILYTHTCDTANWWKHFKNVSVFGVGDSLDKKLNFYFVKMTGFYFLIN